MLEYKFWGNTLEDWGISLIIILIAVIVSRLVSFLNRKVFIPYAQKTKTSLDNILTRSVEPPLIFGIMLLGMWIAIDHLASPDGFVKVVNTAYKILVVLNVTWLFARLFNNLIDVYWVNRDSTTTQGKNTPVRMFPVVKRALLVIVWIIGIIMALGNANVDITALLGTLGIGGIAFALAAQDTIKNIFGAFTILTDKPFTIGDTVKIDGFEGTITDVGVRSTKMLTYDNRIVTFPNYKVSDASIENVSSEPMHRIVITIGLTYDTTPEKMNEALNLLKEMPARVKHVSSHGLMAYFSDFLNSSMAITFVFFIEKKGDIRKVRSDVNMEILSAFNKAGLSFAFPSQTIYIESGKSS